MTSEAAVISSIFQALSQRDGSVCLLVFTGPKYCGEKREGGPQRGGKGDVCVGGGGVTTDSIGDQDQIVFFVDPPYRLDRFDRFEVHFSSTEFRKRGRV